MKLTMQLLILMGSLLTHVGHQIIKVIYVLVCILTVVEVSMIIYGNCVHVHYINDIRNIQTCNNEIVFHIRLMKKIRRYITVTLSISYHYSLSIHNKFENVMRSSA